MFVLLLILAKFSCVNPANAAQHKKFLISQKSSKASYAKESFENWPPASFSLSPQSGNGAWLQSPVISADYISPQTGAEGQHAAEFDTWDYSSGVSGDMVSIPIDLSSATNPLLSFYFWNHTDETGYGNGDSVIVFISVDNGADWSVLDVLKGNVDIWTQHSYNLTAYIGDTIEIKFEGVSDYGGSNMGIDEIVLGEVPPYDAALKEVLVPYEYDSVHSIQPSVIVSSEGTSTLTDFYVFAEAAHNGNSVYRDSMHITSLASGNVDTVIFKQFTPDSGYYYDFLFYTQYPGDGFTLNDSARIKSRFYYSNRIVVGELTTNAGCDPCKPANDSLDNIFPDYPNKLALIRYHCWWPSNTDPFYQYNVSGNTARVNYYGADYAPHFHIDGIVDGKINKDEWRGMLESEMNKKSPVAMSIAGSYDDIGGGGELSITLKFTGEPTDTLLRLRVALVENGLQYNASNGQTVFYQVFRKMYPDVNGTTINYHSLGEVVGVNVPFTLDTAHFDEDSLAFVAFLQSDETHKILQGAKISLSELAGIGTQRNSNCSFRIIDFSIIGHKALKFACMVTHPGHIKLSIYDGAGRVIKEMTQEHVSSGLNRFTENIKKYKNGVYFLQVEYDNAKLTKRFVIAK